MPSLGLIPTSRGEATLLKLIPAQLPWWLGGPGLGLCVLALYGLANRRLGVSGAWLAAVVAPIEGWRGEHGRVEFLIALTTGALTVGVLGSATRLTSYPVLSHTLPAVVLLPLVTVAGLALGYGARWAGLTERGTTLGQLAQEEASHATAG